MDGELQRTTGVAETRQPATRDPSQDKIAILKEAPASFRSQSRSLTTPDKAHKWLGETRKLAVHAR